MLYILAFAGSNSSTSINYKLVRHTTELVSGYELRLMDMSKCPFPMYSEDHEKEKGFSNSLVEFKDDIQNAAGIIISVNEHNSNPSAYFKNLIDWLSRLDKNCFKDKRILLMSASQGKRGAKSSLEISKNLLERFGAIITGTFSLPNFSDNFDVEKGMTDAALIHLHKEQVTTFLDAIR